MAEVALGNLRLHFFITSGRGLWDCRSVRDVGVWVEAMENQMCNILLPEPRFRRRTLRVALQAISRLPGVF